MYQIPSPWNCPPKSYMPKFVLISLHFRENNAYCGLPQFNHTVTMVAPSPHKPRRRIKKANNGSGSEVSTAISSSDRTTTTRPSYPLAAFLWPARSSVSQWVVLPLILMAVGLFRWAAGLWGYSGKLCFTASLLQSLNVNRLPKPTYARRLRSSKTLDGNYDAVTDITVVLPRSRILGIGLPSLDGIS